MTAQAPSPSPATQSIAILVAEDDPASGRFFQVALAARGWDTTLGHDGLVALALARQQRFDVLVLDCHMPGANAAHILTALRVDAGAASHATPAIATSAELDAPQRRQLQQAGFADTLCKPTSIDSLQATVQALLPHGSGAPAALLDNRVALQSSGSLAAVNALRGLFAAELRRLANELEALTTRPSRLAERLHRLLASCGFCGANAMADACRQLKQQLEHGDAPAPAELARFRRTLELTLQGIEERGTGGEGRGASSEGRGMRDE